MLYYRKQNISTSLLTDLIPTKDNTYKIGSNEFRWKSLSVGPGTINITDKTTGEETKLSVDNGTLLVDGVSLIEVPGIKFADRSIQTTAIINNSGQYIL